MRKQDKICEKKPDLQINGIVKNENIRTVPKQKG